MKNNTGKLLLGTTFEEIWRECAWIVEDMQTEGMCFFEGYVLQASRETLLSGLTHLTTRAKTWTCQYSIWTDQSTEYDRNATYSLEQHLDLFWNNRILMLHVDYQWEVDGLELSLKLIFEHIHGLTIEIICYREAILQDPITGMQKAIAHIRELKRLFGGQYLFIGPDTLKYPEHPIHFPQEWIRIE